VLTPRTFEGPQIVSRLLWFNARQIHLCCALWAIRTRVNGSVIKRVFGKRHFSTSLFAGGRSRALEIVLSGDDFVLMSPSDMAG
jgi:hypothetical protein